MLLVTIAVALVSHFLFTFGENVGDRCKLSTGQEGFYRPIEDCGSKPEACQSSYSLVCCPESGKAKKKCMEYGQYVYTEDYGMTLLTRKSLSRILDCPIAGIPLVVGGERAKPKEFPHMVAIGFGPDLNHVLWMCGGSLISEKHVLSAAHCAKSRDRGPARWARLGDTNLGNGDEEGNRQDYAIEQRIVHPRYKPPSSYHDIAIFVLSREVELDGYTRPACLNVLPQEFEMGNVTATGWGKLDYTNSGSDNLMKVTLSIIDYGYCNLTYRSEAGDSSLKYGIQPSQICAGGIKDGRDTCQGDSGGPLQIELETPYCMYSIVAITSFGKFCGFGTPAVYTKVWFYIPWIESIVWP